MAKNSTAVYGASGKSNVLMMDPEQLVLVTDEKSPLYDERVHLPINERMVRSIMRQGVRQAITIWKNPETGKTEVVTGRQRVKNTIEANRRLVADGLEPKFVPAIPRRDEALGLMTEMVSENEIREADAPLTRARKMARMLAHGATEEQVCDAFGCTTQTVRDSMLVLDCTAAVRDAVDAGKIGVTHAKKLAKLEPAEQRAKVAELVKAGEGARPHARAAAQRAVVESQTPKVRGKRELIKARDAAAGDVRAALDWVLGVADQLPGATA